MNNTHPHPITTGRIAFIDETTVIYVPWQPTIEDIRGALREIYHKGITRPKPGNPAQAERVYPIEYCVTEDPRTWLVFWRNDHAELIETTLHIRDRAERSDAGPLDRNATPHLADPFRAHTQPPTAYPHKHT